MASQRQDILKKDRIKIRDLEKSRKKWRDEAMHSRAEKEDLQCKLNEAQKEYFREAVPEEGAVPGAVVTIHSFGDFLGWHPHLHVLCTDGCFCGNGMFRVAPLLELKHLEEIFRYKVFKILLLKGNIHCEDLVDMLMKWHHSGLNVFCGSLLSLSIFTLNLLVE